MDWLFSASISKSTAVQKHSQAEERFFHLLHQGVAGIEQAIELGADPCAWYVKHPLSIYIVKHNTDEVNVLLRWGVDPNLTTEGIVYDEHDDGDHTIFGLALHLAQRKVDINALDAVGDAYLEIIASCVIFGGSVELLKQYPDLIEALCKCNYIYSLPWDPDIKAKLLELIKTGFFTKI